MKTKLSSNQKQELLEAARAANQDTGEVDFWDEVSERLQLYEDRKSKQKDLVKPRNIRTI